MAETRLSEFSVLGVKISAINMDDACSLVEDTILKRQKKYICVCSVNAVMECKKNGRVFNSVNSADMVTPDGMPMVWIGKMYGYGNMKRVYGPEFMQNVCGISATKGYRHYFYGSSENILNRLKTNLVRKYPGIRIAGMFSPPFRQLTTEEDRRIVEDINSTNPDIVWVGLGAPKQDLWMYEHKDRINAPLMIGVGAAFDFLAGVKPQAPRWMSNNGFEWLFRLITEPRRLWRRYLINNSLFIYYFGIELFSRFFSPQRRDSDQHLPSA